MSDREQANVSFSRENRIEAKNLFEKVNVNVSDLNLSVKLNIKVKQEVAIKVPLKAIVSYENAEIK